jgi:hypothetical protein
MISVRTDLGDLSSGGRFHERAAPYLQGVGPNVITRFNNGLYDFEAVQDSTDYLASYCLKIVTVIV